MHVWGHVRFDCNGILIEISPLVVESRAERDVASKLIKSTRLMIMKGVSVCKNVCMHVWGHVRFDGKGILIETSPLVVESRAERGVASKLMKSTRLMIMKGVRVLDSVKMFACMFGGM